MAYTQYVPTTPVDTQNGPAVVASARNNLLALRDGVIAGRMPGWTLTVSGGSAEEPAIRLWSNGVFRIRASYTYGGGFVSAVAWEFSSNSGVGYDSICNETATYDVNGNMTGGANSALSSWLYEWAGKLKVIRTNVAALIATIGTLGSMALQSAANIAVTGGSAVLSYNREVVTALGNVAVSTPVNWANQGVVTLTVTNAAAAITHTSLPAALIAGTMVFRITNGGIATNLFPGALKPGGAALGLSVSGVDYVTVISVGGTLDIVGVAKAMA